MICGKSVLAVVACPAELCELSAEQGVLRAGVGLVAEGAGFGSRLVLELALEIDPAMALGTEVDLTLLE